MVAQKRQQARWNEKLITQKGGPGRRAFIPQQIEVPRAEVVSAWKRQKAAVLPEVSELELVRHIVRLSQMNHGVDVGPYPLGSCTMKYNPKVNERIARFDAFGMMHPDAPDIVQQGNIEVLYRLQEVLKGITGFGGVTVQPAAGAQGEYVGMLITKAYHESRGETKRNKVLVPDTAHGTNPASAAMAGYKVVELPSTENGYVDLEALEAALDDTVAAFMITNPNTLGIFEPHVKEISEKVHKYGALMYLDGANFNGVVGVVKSVDMGFDIQHFNLHKTFSGPHGGGGPGCGPVGVVDHLVEFLPKPLAAYDAENDRYYFDYDLPKSIGRVHGYHGNFGIAIRALAHIYRNGGEGLRKMCEAAVLNANYLMEKVKKIKGFSVPLAEGIPRKHEFIASPVPLMRETGINAGDIAKAILDYGIHSPTVYFPMIVKEALLIEPTEGETNDDLDAIVDALREIAEKAY
ncbi:MAG: aminomethyl-transferring glycine dehydrogenase subunit GcvPB, partial [Candidatus Kariarchaeaceae archaeon]